MKVSGWYMVGFYGVIAAVIFFLGWKCRGDRIKSKGTDVVRTIRDTVPGVIQVVIDTHYVPKPYKVGVFEGIPRGFSGDSKDTVIQLVQIDTSQILIDYHRRRYYSDTVSIDHGTAVINDTVSQNRITGRSLKVSQRIPVIKETVTLYQPKRNIVYLGVNVQGGPQNYLFAAGADLSLKTKNDRIYSIGASLTRDNQVLYQGGVRFPIRLRIFDKR